MRHPTSAGSWREACRRAILGASLLGIALAAHSLQGGDDTVGDEKEPRPQQQNFQKIALDQQMRAMLGNGNGNERVAEVVREKAQARLELEIERVDEICGLNEAQRAKLTLAARLETARAVQRFEAFQVKYAGRTLDLQTQEGQEAWARFHQEMNEIQLAAPRHGERKSLIGRLLVGGLDDRQRGAWEAEAALRQASQWRRFVDAGLLHIGSSAGMTDRQHEALVALLMEDPPRVDMGKTRESFGDFNPVLCWYAMARLDEARLEAIFDARQWAKVRNVIEQGKVWRPTLESLNVLEE
ncbi:MAG: hypothetical protein WCJ31_16925 [Planctomycetia bacterium]